MSRRAATLLAAATLVAGAAGCGGDEDRGNGGDGLVWSAKPLLVTPKTLPNDRILSGKIRNDSPEEIDIDARALRLVRRDGSTVRGTSAVFLQTFAHQIYPPTREPANIPDSELLRLGRKATIGPDEEVPLTISWRERRGEAPPVRVDYGAGTVSIR